MSGTKAVVLLSGGLDSVVLTHHVMKEFGEDEVIGVFFDYGQLTAEKEYKCAERCIWQLKFQGYKAKLIRVDLKDAFLKDSSLFGKGENEEIPMRNLLFAVRGAQIALQEGADVVYAGFIDPLKPDGSRYVDTSPDFTEKVNEVFNLFGVQFCAPLLYAIKWDVAFYAKYYDIDLNDVWSCNFPVVKDNGEIEPCGKCGNCKFYEEAKEVVWKPSLKDLWFKHGMNVSDEFREAYMKEKVVEARLLINSSCNMTCKHCFYGFENGKTRSRELKLDEWFKLIDELAEFGIENFHFSGKEPLLNAKIFKLADYTRQKYPHITYEVVTNGKTVEKYLDQIVNAGFKRVILSFESFDEDFIRENYALKSLRLLKGKVPIAVYVDLTQFSYDKLEYNIHRLYEELDVRDFWVRPVYYYGNAVGIENVLLTNEQVYEVYLMLKRLAEELKDAKIAFHIKDSYVEGIIPIDEKRGGTFYKDLHYVMKTGDEYLGNGFSMHLQMFCTKYAKQITIQSDGWMLGCGVEVCHSNYDEKSAGNIRDDSVLNIVKRGKERTLEIIAGNLACRTTNGCNICAGGCTSKNYCYNFKSATLNPFGEH